MTVTVPTRTTISVLPAGLLSASGFVLFALENRPLGFSMLATALLLAVLLNLALARDLVLIAFGLVVMSLVPITTDISTGHMLEMGAAMIAAVAVPYAVSRWVYRDHAIRFPLRTGKPWTRAEKLYLWVVPPLGYVMLAYYMVSTGVYMNWPAASAPEDIIRLFIGTNGLGIWDELFFICTTFTLLRRHLPEWQATLLQAVLFTSFLWELGFEAWGPLFIFPFALLQARLFTVTKSLSYIISVHLLFDFVLFLVLLQVHNSGWWDAYGL